MGLKKKLRIKQLGLNASSKELLFVVPAVESHLYCQFDGGIKVYS